MSTQENQQREELRQAVLEVVATRFPTALEAETVRRRIIHEKLLDREPSVEEVTAALEFLTGMELLTVLQGTLGASRYWKATPAGVLAWERKETMTRE